MYINSISVENTDLTKLVKDEFEYITRHYDVDILKTNPVIVNTTLLGNPAREAIFEYNDGNRDIMMKFVIMLKDYKVYKITYFAEPSGFYKYLPIVQKMLNTLKIELSQYENTNLGISIQYPLDWQVEEDNKNSIIKFFAPDHNISDTYLSVYVYETPIDLRLGDIQSSEVSRQDFKLIKSSNTTRLGENMARLILYTFTSGRDEIKGMMIFTINDGKVYQIKFFARPDKFDNYLPIVQKIIDSFRIVDYLPSKIVDIKTYENPLTGIKMKYPSDWHKVEEKTRVYFKSPSYDGNLSIEVVPSENRLEDIVGDQISALRQEIPEMIELNTSTLGGNDAYKIVYSYNYSKPTKVMTLITLKENKAYYINFISDTERYYDYLPIIQIMLNSIVIDPIQSVNSLFQEINHGEDGIRVASNPFAIAFNPITKMLYVSNTRSNTISVIDTSRNNIISNITVGSFPYSIALDERQNTIYVANEKSNTLSVIDGSTNRPVDTIRVDKGPVEIAVNTYTDRVYTANFCSNSISVIEGSTNTVLKNITLGERPDSCSEFGMGIAVNTFTNTIYVTNRDFDTIYVIDGNTDNIVDKIHADGLRPVSVAVNPITNTIYSVRSDSPNGQVDVIDGYSNNVVTQFSGQNVPNMIIVNPSTNMVYITNSGNDTLSVINGSNNTPLLNVIVGSAPAGVTVDEDTNTLYVANILSNTVSVINGNTNKIMVGVNFNVDPVNSGEIHCNDNKIQNNDYQKYDIGTELKCEAMANNIFPPIKFASWSIIPPMMFASWTGDLTSDPDDNPTATFKAFRHGNLVANFKELITTDYANTIFGTVLSLAIPTIGGVLYKKREWLSNKFGRQNN